MGTEVATMGPSMVSRLDLRCPLPWPSVRIGGGSVHSNDITGTSSSPALIRHATASSSSSGLLMPLPISSGEIDINDGVNGDPWSPRHWLAERYAETLWLGERHSSLSTFLRDVQHLQSRVCGPKEVLECLRYLQRPRARIHRRLQQVWAEPKRLLALLAVPYDPHSSDDMDETEKAEASIVQTALQEGPARIVASELHQGPQRTQIGRLGQVWIDAIETRELQLQILVILLLLQLHAEHPTLHQPTPSQREGHEEANKIDESPTQARKRRRKAEKSHRWTGTGSMFPWQMGMPSANPRARSSSSLTDPSRKLSDAGLNEAEPSDPESLAKRFESLTDALCLRVVTTPITVELNDSQVSVSVDSSAADHTPSKTLASKLAASPHGTGRTVLVPPFGSEGRRKERRDERDGMQWFCGLVETAFAKTLPRQCGMLRSRCYLPINATPAKKVRTTSSKTVSERSGRTSSSSQVERPKKRAAESRQGLVQSRSSSNQRESDLLHQSLMDETRSKAQRTQSMAAAKQRTTWDAREVSVRKRWERSHSVGASQQQQQQPFERAKDVAGSKAASITQNVRASRMAAVQASQPSVASHQSIEGIRRKERDADGAERTTFTLVLDTPSKPRPVQVLPTRRREAMPMPSYQSQTAGMHFDHLASPWRRSESQPASAFGAKAFLADLGLDDDDDEPLIGQEKDGDDDVFGKYMEGGERQTGTASSSSKLIGSRSSAQIISPRLPPSSRPVGDEEGEEIEERIVLGRNARLQVGSLASLASYAQKPSLNSGATLAPMATSATGSPTSLCPSTKIPLPQRTLSGRNPFAR